MCNKAGKETGKETGMEAGSEARKETGIITAAILLLEACQPRG